MEEHWTSAANEMVAYFGREAVSVATRRAEDLARRGDWRAADRAMLLLSRVERLNRERGMGHA
ncbi:hypothetical protein CCC_02666 [Paramagnetospirillum magnetotacticum MS-1]|uniref:Uncharacterized protein n=1 Tax=Paramagnetospirillum magnetotacticum MS-1 TaxID=272627 RepID=A0A0C2UEE8_PARME|nr:hypothetical protein [Paramagnetospirillum magnetotacticum]KIL99877.1 hypothetical protein CCC_02666 [Paramagnetospirillum magnetotacticum MS-1]